VDEDIQGNTGIIQDIYRDLGYTDTTVSYEIIPSKKNRATIRYLITEGNRRLVRLATIEGLPLDLSSPKLPSQPVSTRAINDLITDLAQQLKDAGYHGATLSLHAQSLHPTEAVSPIFILTVHPGAPVTLSRITIEGNVSVPNIAILNALRMREGQPWAQPALEEGRRKILKLGLFSSVLFTETSTPDPLRRELTIKVVERPLSFLRLGGGANSQFGAHVFGEASDRSLFLDGRELSFRADLFVLPSTLEVSQGIALLIR
jgi:outer membrane protein assembly factor BamA